jgi:hypothetical protein
MKLPVGWIALHTGKGKIYLEHARMLKEECPNIPEEITLPHGCIVGAMRVDRACKVEDLIGTSMAPWARGPVCNVIGAVCRLDEPVPHSGVCTRHVCLSLRCNSRRFAPRPPRNVTAAAGSHHACAGRRARRLEDRRGRAATSARWAVRRTHARAPLFASATDAASLRDLVTWEAQAAFVRSGRQPSGRRRRRCGRLWRVQRQRRARERRRPARRAGVRGDLRQA